MHTGVCVMKLFLMAEIFILCVTIYKIICVRVDSVLLCGSLLSVVSNLNKGFMKNTIKNCSALFHTFPKL